MLGAGAASAEAATLRGQTHRGMHVKVTTDAKGRATAAVYFWRVRRCDLGRYSYGGATAVDSKKRPATHFFTSNPYTVRSRGGFRTRITVHSTAHRLSIYRWKGTFSVVAVIRRHGRVADRCRIHRLHWTASTPQARLDLSSDQGDYILQGKSYSYATPGQHLTVLGDRHRVSIGAGPWTLLVKAPAGRTLKPGHFPNALREPFSGRHAGVELSGDGRGCNEIKGEFTVERARFDKRGVKFLTLSFVQHCEGADPAARGTLKYHR
jgi:hypothetical protein